MMGNILQQPTSEINTVRKLEVVLLRDAPQFYKIRAGEFMGVSISFEGSPNSLVGFAYKPNDSSEIISYIGRRVRGFEVITPAASGGFLRLIQGSYRELKMTQENEREAREYLEAHLGALMQ